MLVGNGLMWSEQWELGCISKWCFWGCLRDAEEHADAATMQLALIPKRLNHILPISQAVFPSFPGQERLGRAGLK